MDAGAGLSSTGAQNGSSVPATAKASSAEPAQAAEPAGAGLQPDTAPPTLAAAAAVGLPDERAAGPPVGAAPMKQDVDIKQEAAAEGEEPLEALQQAFFDQPTQLPALQARLAELEELRQARVFTDGGALWDRQLARLRRYVRLLRAVQQEPHAAAPVFVPRCDLCGQQAGGAEGGGGAPLRRMQLMGQRDHLAVCSACSEARKGSLIPLTPLWELDQAAWSAILPALQPQQQATQAQQQQRQQQRPGAPPQAAGSGRGGKKAAAAASAGGSRPGSATGHRGKSTFKATSHGWVKLITKGNMHPSAGLAPRIYLPFGVFWFWVDRLPGAEALASESAAPRMLRLTHAESQAIWHVPLLRTDDGMQLQPAALRPMFEQLGVAVDTHLLIQLDVGECSLQRGFVGAVSLIGRGGALPDLPGDPVAPPRSAAAASGLASSKKRKGTHTTGRGGGGGHGSEAFEWDDAWDEAGDADVSFSLPPGQPVDGPGGAGRSKRRGAGGRLAFILRHEQPEAEGDSEDGDFEVAAEAPVSEQEEEVDTAGLPFEPRRTSSVDAALQLAAELPPDFPISGAHAPSSGTAQKWGVYLKRRGFQPQWFGRLDRQRAAVAADLVICWHRRLRRQAGLNKLIFGEPEASGGGAAAVDDDGEAAELAAEVAAMAAAAAAATGGGGGSSFPAASRPAAAAAEESDAEMEEAGEEEEQMSGGGAAAGGGRSQRRINLPAAGYEQDIELMQQLSQVESPYQMLLLLTAAVPQDALPRHLQRHQQRPPSSQRQRPPVPRPPSQQQQAQQQQVQQGPAQPPQQQQARPPPAQGRPPKPHHQRKPKKASGQQAQQKQGPAGAAQQPGQEQQQASAPAERRRVGVVWVGEEQRWAAAAVCSVPGDHPATLRVGGLQTLAQAEVARDLLALWGWQAAQQGLQPPGASAAVGADSKPGSAGASGAHGQGPHGDVDSTAPALPQAQPPLPPLNFPLVAYQEHTHWLQELAELQVDEVEGFVHSVAEQLSDETLQLLEAARPVSPLPAAGLAAPPPAAPSEAGTGMEEGPGGEGGEGELSEASGQGPTAAAEDAAGTGASPATPADHFDLLAALAEAAAGGEAAPTPERPAGGSGGAYAGGPAALSAAEAALGSRGEGPGGPSAAPFDARPAAGSPFQAAQQQQQQQVGVMPAPLRQHSTASAAGLQQPMSPGSGGGGGAAAGPGLLEKLEQAAQRKVAQAEAAFEGADMASTESMLRPLRILAAANKGGQLLKDVVRSWSSYSPAQRQEMFDGAMLATAQRDWEQLEDSLRLALDML